jgi:hypothetical protein
MTIVMDEDFQGPKATLLLNGEMSPSTEIDEALSGGPQVAPAAPFDDLERALGIGDDDIQVSEVLIDLACRKPKKTEFFRANGDPNMTRPAYVFLDKDEIGAEPYLVLPEARPFIADHLRPVQLVVCINRQNVPFIWPVALPDLNTNAGRHNRWGASALEVMKIAQRAWVKMLAGDGAYRAFAAESSDLPEPQWPDRSFHDLVKAAFKDRLITGPDHPVVKKLRGRI